MATFTVLSFNFALLNTNSFLAYPSFSSFFFLQVLFIMCIGCGPVGLLAIGIAKEMGAIKM